MKCIKCGKKADKKYSPDLDIKGIGMCKDHEQEIMLDIITAQYNDWNSFNNKYK